MRRRRRRRHRRRQRGRGLDIQKWLGKTGLEFHWPGYQYMGPGTHLQKRLKRGDPGIRDLKQTLEAARWKRRWPRGSGLRPPPLGAKSRTLSWRRSGGERRLFRRRLQWSNLTFSWILRA